MGAKLELLREMAEQREYQALQQACADSLLLGDDSAVMILLMLAYANTGESDRALSLLNVFHQEVDLACLSPSERLDLGSLCSALALYEDAESLFDALLEQSFCLGAVLGTVWAKKGYCRLIQGDELGAERAFLCALDCPSRPLEVVINLCIMHLARCSDTTLAELSVASSIETVQQYLTYAEQDHIMASDGQSVECFSSEYRLGLRDQLDSIRLECWVRQGALAFAESWLKETLEDAPRYLHGVVCYAQYLVDDDRAAVAEAVLLQALKKYPNSESLYQEQAQWGRENGQNVSLHPVVNKVLSARVRARFSDAFVRSRHVVSSHSDCPPEISGFCPVFILGLPFSGVSLLEEGLLATGQVGSLGVSSAIPLLIEGINLKQRDLGTLRAYPDNLDVLTAEQIRHFALGIQSVYQAKQSKYHFILDKNPDNIHHVGLIKWLFPQAKFISMSRNSHEWLASKQVEQWLNHLGVASAQDKAEWLGVQFAGYKALLSHWQRLFPDDILQVSFHQLTQTPAETLQTVGDFVDIGQTDDACLADYYESVRSVRSVRSVSSARLSEQKKPSRRGKANSITALLVAFNQAAMTKQTMTKQTIAKQTIAKQTAAEASDMVTLPKAGMLSEAYRLYAAGGDAQGRLESYRDAEYQCKVLLHHLPDFAPAQYLLGELYLVNGLLELGIAAIEKAIALAPWKSRRWGRNLAQAYQRLSVQKETL
ncbi:sulfotransferase [Marinomonas sp. M1K-6]|uniref:Sulfotransferase n=1 Tax=Marinomonas profundi TaxID=2726122 RepID=A0A847RAZ9_9GAMM|nr:sulfotransferase [Marinomonas profundi]NLQ18134.1 sulfotransferase [Marinomonas profundi]UDV04082.1 sulfotransferase [Marinomonas profundi]